MYVGAFETAEACEKWKSEYDLKFPVVPDEDGTLFTQLANGWVPASVLVGPDGTVLFVENQFDDVGFSDAIEAIYTGPKDEPHAEAPASEIDALAIPASAPQAATILVLGCGTGGLVAANKLRQQLGRQHRVVVVDRSADYLFEPSLLWFMAGLRKQEQLFKSLEGLRRKGIELITEEIESIDPKTRVVHTTNSEIGYDYLVIALGTQTVPETVPGFSEMAFDLYSTEGCRKIQEALAQWKGGTVGVLVTAMPFKCPAAPYEAAFLVESYVRNKGIRDKTEIHLFTPEHQPMPILDPAIGASVVGMLEARGIHYHPLFTFEGLDPKTKEVKASTSPPQHVDLLIGVPPHQAPDIVRKSGLVGASGFIHVDPQTLRTEHERVFAIGDVTTVKLPNGKSLPKAGVFAHGQAEVVAERIAAELKGKTPHATFDGRGFCWLETGDGKAGFAGGGFFMDPEPQVRMRPPRRMWHWAKVAFEKWWMRWWF